VLLAGLLSGCCCATRPPPACPVPPGPPIPCPYMSPCSGFSLMDDEPDDGSHPNGYVQSARIRLYPPPAHIGGLDPAPVEMTLSRSTLNPRRWETPSGQLLGSVIRVSLHVTFAGEAEKSSHDWSHTNEIGVVEDIESVNVIHRRRTIVHDDEGIAIRIAEVEVEMKTDAGWSTPAPIQHPAIRTYLR